MRDERGILTWVRCPRGRYNRLRVATRVRLTAGSKKPAVDCAPTRHKRGIWTYFSGSDGTRTGALTPHDSFTHETLMDLIAAYSGAQNQ